VTPDSGFSVSAWPPSFDSADAVGYQLTDKFMPLKIDL